MIRSLLISLLLAAPVAAQTVEEAARSNVALGTGLCVDAMLNGSAASTVFGTAGFVYRGVDRGTNSYGVALGVDHYFDAPADTAKVKVMELTNHPGLCQVYTTHLDETEMARVVSGVLYQKHPGTTAKGFSEWIVRQGENLPLIVTVSSIGTSHRYETPGTVTVTMGFPG